MDLEPTSPTPDLVLDTNAFLDIHSCHDVSGALEAL